MERRLVPLVGGQWGTGVLLIVAGFRAWSLTALTYFFLNQFNFVFIFVFTQPFLLELLNLFNSKKNCTLQESCALHLGLLTAGHVCSLCVLTFLSLPPLSLGPL